MGGLGEGDAVSSCAVRVLSLNFSSSVFVPYLRHQTSHFRLTIAQSIILDK